MLGERVLTVNVYLQNHALHINVFAVKVLNFS